MARRCFSIWFETYPNYQKLHLFYTDLRQPRKIYNTCVESVRQWIPIQSWPSTSMDATLESMWRYRMEKDGRKEDGDGDGDWRGEMASGNGVKTLFERHSKFLLRSWSRKWEERGPRHTPCIPGSKLWNLTNLLFLSRLLNEFAHQSKNTNS